jgi:hypothetical protein
MTAYRGSWRGQTVALLMMLLSGEALAQQVNLQVREQGSLVPVAGALVRLLGDSGMVVQILTGATGRAILLAPTAGRYRIRVDRIGALGMVTAHFELAKGETRDTDLLLQADRVMLPPLEVSASNRCGRRTDERSFAAILWGEIAKALSASTIAEQANAIPLRAQGFRRELLRDGSPVREWRTTASLHGGKFYATPPPASLMARGFVVAGQDSVSYFAPDAELLLSDEFVATHCFRAREGPAGLVGLAFELESRRTVVDVTGTLWVHRESGELRFLEFTYVGLPRDLQKLGLGGRVDYLRLPGGAWIVSSWFVRAPILDAVPARTDSRVHTKVVGRGNALPRPPALHHAGFTEVGGRISVATESVPPKLAVIVGQAIDSTTQTGLNGVVVRLAGGFDDSVVTDASGAFVLLVSAHGQHELIADHPKLILPGAKLSQTVNLSLGDTSRVEFTVPGARTLAQPFCGRRNDRAGLVGRVLDGTGNAVTEVAIRAEWRTATGARKEEKARSEAGGLYALCNLPSDEVISIEWRDQSGVVRKQQVELDWRSIRWLDLRSQPDPDA